MKNYLLPKILTCFIFLSFLQPINSQSIDNEKLNEYFQVLDANSKFMGSIAVTKDGNLMYSKTIGYSDVENSIKANENSAYKIGSISKTFTAVLVLKAVELGKLDLNQSLNTFFPRIKNAEKITIYNLLNHRSGIHNFTDLDEYFTWNTKPISEIEMINFFSELQSDFEPNSKADYSNTNYVILSYILQKVMNKSYNDLLQEYICKPIGLKNTYFPKNSSEDLTKSYSYVGKWKEEPITDPSISMGAGSILSTSKDLTTFSNALFTGRILKPESLEKMKTIHEGYGLGLFQIPFYDKVGLGHSGKIDGFSSIFIYFPDENVSYAMISNGATINTNDVSIVVLSAVFGKSFKIPEFKNVEISSEKLKSYLGVYSSANFPLKIMITQEGNNTHVVGIE